MADLTQFDFPSAVRIARVVRAIEQEPRRARPLTFGPVVEQRRVFRMATFTGAWAKDTFKTVTLRGATATISSVNVFADIAASGSARDCAIARSGTAWYLIAAEC